MFTREYISYHFEEKLEVKFFVLNESLIFDNIHNCLLVFFQSFVSNSLSSADVNLGHMVRVILWTVLYDLNLGKQLSVIPPRDPTANLFNYLNTIM